MNFNSRWIFTKEKLSNTPSSKDGFDVDKELSYRQDAARFIQELGQRLHLKFLPINTAIVYMHRFYLFHSLAKFNKYSIGSAALFLGAKNEEQFRNADSVVRGSMKLLNFEKINPESLLYKTCLDDLLFHEQLLIQTLGFEFTVEHPQTHILQVCATFETDRELAQISWHISSHIWLLTNMCLLHHPRTIAAVGIYISCKWFHYEVPEKDGKIWYKTLDNNLSLKFLEEITQEFLVIVKQFPKTFKNRMLLMKDLRCSLPDEVVGYFQSADDAKTDSKSNKRQLAEVESDISDFPTNGSFHESIDKIGNEDVTGSPQETPQKRLRQDDSSCHDETRFSNEKKTVTSVGPVIKSHQGRSVPAASASSEPHEGNTRAVTNNTGRPSYSNQLQVSSPKKQKVTATRPNNNFNPDLKIMTQDNTNVAYRKPHNSLINDTRQPSSSKTELQYYSPIVKLSQSVNPSPSIHNKLNSDGRPHEHQYSNVKANQMVIVGQQQRCTMSHNRNQNDIERQKDLQQGAVMSHNRSQNDTERPKYLQQRAVMSHNRSQNDDIEKPKDLQQRPAMFDNRSQNDDIKRQKGLQQRAVMSYNKSQNDDIEKPKDLQQRAVMSYNRGQNDTERPRDLQQRAVMSHNRSQNDDIKRQKDLQQRAVMSYNRSQNDTERPRDLQQRAVMSHNRSQNDDIEKPKDLQQRAVMSYNRGQNDTERQKDLQQRAVMSHNRNKNDGIGRKYDRQERHALSHNIIQSVVMEGNQDQHLRVVLSQNRYQNAKTEKHSEQQRIPQSNRIGHIDDIGRKLEQQRIIPTKRASQSDGNERRQEQHRSFLPKRPENVNESERRLEQHRSFPPKRSDNVSESERRLEQHRSFPHRSDNVNESERRLEQQRIGHIDRIGRQEEHQQRVIISHNRKQSTEIDKQPEKRRIVPLNKIGHIVRIERQREQQKLNEFLIFPQLQDGSCGRQSLLKKKADGTFQNRSQIAASSQGMHSGSSDFHSQPKMLTSTAVPGNQDLRFYLNEKRSGNLAELPARDILLQRTSSQSLQTQESSANSFKLSQILSQLNHTR